MKQNKYNAVQFWAKVGETIAYFKSKAEFRYAIYLQSLKESGKILAWNYEPQTFYFPNIKRGINNYTPDFAVCKPSNQLSYIEVKGFMDNKSKTKIDRFKRFYDHLPLTVVKRDWFDKNKNSLAILEISYINQGVVYVFKNKEDAERAKKTLSTPPKIQTLSSTQLSLAL